MKMYYNIHIKIYFSLKNHVQKTYTNLYEILIAVLGLRFRNRVLLPEIFHHIFVRSTAAPHIGIILFHVKSEPVYDIALLGRCRHDQTIFSFLVQNTLERTITITTPLFADIDRLGMSVDSGIITQQST